MLRKLTLTSMLLGCALTAQAGVLTPAQQVSSGWIDTNFGEYRVQFDKFDTQGGSRMLKKIHFQLLGETTKDFYAENTSSSSGAAFDVVLGTKLKLTTFGGIELISTLPEYEASFILSTFDGSIDYTGYSGLKNLGLYAKKLMQSSITSQSLLTMFSGPGSISTVLWGTSRDAVITTGGNVTNSVRTKGAATAYVQYEYELQQVSAPATLGLFGLGLLGLMLRARRK